MRRKRIGVSPRVRFEVFKRDGFRCLYCGATPLSKPLHVDHVRPVAEGGDNSPANLVTACSDCNLGKSAVPLSERKLATPIATQADRDHAAQILAYLAIQREVAGARTEARNAVADRWREVVGGMSQHMYDRLQPLIEEWPMEDIEEAMQITAGKLGTAGQEYDGGAALKQCKYFYGILRRWRENDVTTSWWIVRGVPVDAILRFFRRPRFRDLRLDEVTWLATERRRIEAGSLRPELVLRHLQSTVWK